MMEKWKRRKTSDISSRITSGGTPSRKRTDFFGGNIPWLTTKEVNFNRIFDTEEKITEEGLIKSSAKLIEPNSVIIAMYGATAGKVAINKIPLTTNQACCNITVNPDLADYRFIYYKFVNDYEKLLFLATGAAQQNLSVGTISNYEILLPPPCEQHDIANVLTALDDKIDLLHRQNETLEALAQTLFRQWFIEEAEDGWEERPLSFFGEIVCGKTPSKKKPEFFGGDIPFIKIPDMHGNVFVFNTTDTLSESGKNSQINKTLPAKSICVSCIATVGLVSMNIVESQTNQQINSIIPKKPEYRYFLFLLMQRSTDLLTAMASGGTATLNLNTGNFSRINVIFPGEELLLNFHKLIKPLFTKIFHNQSQIKTLEKLIDTFLPKLMCGEVRVQQK